jgi:hypothetical protein
MKNMQLIDVLDDPQLEREWDDAWEACRASAWTEEDLEALIKRLRNLSRHSSVLWAATDLFVKYDPSGNLLMTGLANALLSPCEDAVYYAAKYSKKLPRHLSAQFCEALSYARSSKPLGLTWLAPFQYWSLLRKCRQSGGNPVNL